MKVCKIGVIGTGYVGLVSAACFAEMGHQVIGIDNNADKLKKLKNGEIPFYEPHLQALVHNNMARNRLHFSDSLSMVVRESEVIFLCLPTPQHEDGSADIKSIISVTEAISQYDVDYRIIVNKSTVPPGTSTHIKHILNKGKTKVCFDTVSNPEFLREGNAVGDFMKPDRIIVGLSSQKAKDIMDRIYQPLVKQSIPLLYMKEESAELTKYAANSLLATKITFMNAMAKISEFYDANIEDIERGVGLDNRIGPHFLRSGIGYGGSCFPKDIRAICYAARKHGYSFDMLGEVIKLNAKQQMRLIQKYESYIGTSIPKNTTVAIWGLSFKPDTDDVRESPAFYMIRYLIEKKVHIKAYDPKAMKNFQQVVQKYDKNNSIRYCDTPLEAIKDADVLFICTEWNEFRNISLSDIKNSLKYPIILDGRNMYALSDFEGQNVTYISIGRPSIYVKEFSQKAV